MGFDEQEPWTLSIAGFEVGTAGGEQRLPSLSGGHHHATLKMDA